MFASLLTWIGDLFSRVFGYLAGYLYGKKAAEAEFNEVAFTHGMEIKKTVAAKRKTTRAKFTLMRNDAKLRDDETESVIKLSDGTPILKSERE